MFLSIFNDVFGAGRLQQDLLRVDIEQDGVGLCVGIHTQNVVSGAPAGYFL